MYRPRCLAILHSSPALYVHFLADDAAPPPVYVEAETAGRDSQGCATPAGLGPPVVGFFFGFAATVVHPASAMLVSCLRRCSCCGSGVVARRVGGGKEASKEHMMWG